VHCVAPHVWYKTNSLQTLDTLHDLIMDHLERQSIKMADYVISPTEYMLDWMEAGHSLLRRFPGYLTGGQRISKLRP